MACTRYQCKVTHEKRYVHHAYALVCHELHGIEYAEVAMRALCNSQQTEPLLYGKTMTTNAGAEAYSVLVCTARTRVILRKSCDRLHATGCMH